MVLSSSSSRRETKPEIHHAKSIGCMSGIFQLVSKYQTRRKFLTFGRKPEKNNTTSSPTRTKTQPSPSMQRDNDKQIHNKRDVQKSECHVSRSPTLPAEIRTSNSVNTTEILAEKRMMLLGALQKCDEDLKSLKKIIESLKSVQSDNKPDAVCKVEEEKSCDGNVLEKVNECSSFNSEQPSPVSVLDELTRSPPVSGYLRRQTNGRVIQQQRKKKPGEKDIINLSIFCNKSPPDRYKAENAASPLWCSKAMIEGVEKACKDIAWGEKREVGRIGLALQDHIYRDLIQEIVIEMGFYSSSNSLPFEACRRRLRF